MKYYRLDEDTIEKCRELTISCEVAFVDETGNQHTAKKYGNENVNIKLILMYEYFMPNVIVDKEIISSHLKINRNIKLSSLIAHVTRKNLFVALPMKYCYTEVNTMPFKIIDFNCN
jgi:hypothetical protein